MSGGPAVDRSDVRVRHDTGMGGAIRGFIDRLALRAISAPCRSSIGLGGDLDGVPEPEPGVPFGQQPGQPAVRLLDRGRDRARYRLRADGRRDRPVGRLRLRLRLGAGGRAVGQFGLAGAGGDPAGAAGGGGGRGGVCRAVQPVEHAELRLDIGRVARRIGPAALHPGCFRLHQPAVWFAPGQPGTDLRHAGGGGVWAGADRGRGGVLRRLPQFGAAAERRADPAVAGGHRGQGERC